MERKFSRYFDTLNKWGDGVPNDTSVAFTEFDVAHPGEFAEEIIQTIPKQVYPSLLFLP